MSVICRQYLFVNITEMQICQNIHVNPSSDKIPGILIIQNQVNYKLAVFTGF
jgi:hypothetical protein